MVLIEADAHPKQKVRNEYQFGHRFQVIIRKKWTINNKLMTWTHQIVIMKLYSDIRSTQTHEIYRNDFLLEDMPYMLSFRDWITVYLLKIIFP